MSNSILVDTLLIISGVVLITEVCLISMDNHEAVNKLNGHSSAQILSLSTLGVVTSLMGMYLRGKMESKDKSNYTCAAFMYIISSISGILVSAAFIMINWTIINQTYIAVTPHFLCASMLGSAYLITFVLAILNFLFADFMTLDEEDDMEQYSKVQIV